MTEPIYSPGLEGVIAGETAVSNIDDGLRYRGYSVETLADQGSFEEVAFLILHGRLPASAELASFAKRLTVAAALAPEIVLTLRSIPSTSSMMDVMRTGSSLLSHWDADVADNSHDANLRKAERLLAQLPLVMAAAFRLRQRRELLSPVPNLSFAGNVLWMTTGHKPTQQQTRAMDVTLIMYAEHEFNASTFAARVVSSTLADMHSAITAAIGALKGPLHGSACSNCWPMPAARSQASTAPSRRCATSGSRRPTSTWR